MTLSIIKNGKNAMELVRLLILRLLMFKREILYWFGISLKNLEDLYGKKLLDGNACLPAYKSFKLTNFQTTFKNSLIIF